MPTDLLERDEDLQQLHAWLRDAVAGQGSLLFLGGEAGVGKTALVRQFCEEPQASVRLLTGACDPLSTPRPLGPLADIAAATGGELARLIASGSERSQIFDGFLRELSGAWRPTLAVFEDVHWADEATLDLLRFLGRRIGDTRSLLIATYRDDEVGPAHPLRKVLGELATAGAVRRMNLAPLSVNAVRQLAHGSGLDSEALYRRTGGNPFFVTEVIAASGGIPGTVRDAVLARVAPLSLAAKQTLEIVAVIGPVASTALLADVSSLELTVTEECLTSGMLYTTDQGVAFRHQLARDAVYETIWPPLRKELHARVLRALERSASESRDLALLAHHAEASGDREAVLKYAPAAARRAVALRATREAVAQYERAIRFGDQLPDDERFALLEAYANASDLAGKGEKGITFREEMIFLARRSGDRLKEAEHLGWLAATLAFNGRLKEADQAAHASIFAIEGLPESSKYDTIYTLQSLIHLENRDIAGAIDWGTRAVALAEQSSDVEGIILALHTLGLARMIGRDIAGGRADLDRCLDLARESELYGFVAAALVYLGIGYLENFLFTDAERFLSEAITYATDSESDLDTWLYSGFDMTAQLRLYQGRWNEATSLADRLLSSSRFDDSVTTNMKCTALRILGRIQARCGDPRARLALDEAAALSVSSSGLRFVAPTHIAQAEAAWLAGDRDRTIEAASASYDLALTDKLGWYIGELAYWLWKAGELTAPPAGAAEPFALQIKGDWKGAAAAWVALGCPYEGARALAEADNEEALRSALATFDRLGARPMATIVTKRLRELGANRIPRGPRSTTRGNPAGLTERQTAILALMAEGLRNAEIADRLFLSPKTVEHHISAIFAKLGVSSRAAASHAAIDLGIVSSMREDTVQSTLAHADEN